MKIIKLHNQEKSLIKKAINNNREAQQQLFEQHSPKMLGVCRQYVKDLHHAEDLMLQGFLKVFTNLHRFKHEGSFEGWIRRIMVNTCISYLRKKNRIDLSDEDYVFNDAATESLENTSVEDIQKLIDQLPEGYKMVFNLFAIEGYKHSEIAVQLGISVSTSKSQLFKARKLLQQNYIKMNKVINEDK
ncbi:RNA polymerase subunit sigma-70 [Polaribacter reichenbachii]|uniref:RNA polymerase subunit sigma-70 n=1 Tax=Polaribacter reichenbachii TaxID=996801 RepID=A0A1B8U5C4_9FLAO|nr:sigma-70 family RNA polymerase sigma factor [Polaribacter reichenbachii]APZ47589.1 RNA polymerase subunit sigma-70 [Polaribacter reichenbachii]AUC18229.1 RNA polymerase subunit sigma-70 [Polaribacter reichenbachii]OBY67058.1 RNA polymerase subunit sigma-70 [Polaribacter reichenbachii]